jgi:hypothetical protein
LETVCKSCRHVILIADEQRWRNDEAIKVADRGAIDAWLSNASEKLSLSFEQGGRLSEDHHPKCTILLDEQWNCEVAYDPMYLHFVTVRMYTPEDAKRVHEKRETWQVIAAEHGVQPYGWCNSNEDIAWGVQQFFHTGHYVIRLEHQLLTKTISRLRDAMQDIRTSSSFLS